MNDQKEDVKLGRFISLVLRHRPEAAGIALDKNGWAPVGELIAGMNANGRPIDREKLERIVRGDDKQRYSFSPDGTKIRANQGHSVDVDVEIKETAPPKELYHGTACKFLGGIMRTGLDRRQRQYVHLSADIETAIKVGRRHGEPAVLAVDSRKMAKDGFKFWLSENGVWLCESVPAEYLSLQVKFRQED
ncbi:MAG: RNA 2'-phosphotransferase [Oscillospiraceae bacterium]|jgi:putative RNA 2'-phosphotransferase|nr:RNA 2'-phosphotransferase [Oscillospiraceae bacterium]